MRNLYETSVAKHFDESATIYADFYSQPTAAAEFFNERKALVLRNLAGHGGELLDVGCGPGLMAEDCRQRGFRYTGIDISAGMVTECRRNHTSADVRFLVADSQRLPFRPSTFNAVICMGALEYLPYGREVKAIEEMARVLSVDGILIVSFLNDASLYWRFERLYGSLARLRRGSLRLGRNRPRLPSADGERETPDFVVRKFRAAPCREHLERSGLNVLRTTFFHMPLLPTPLDRRWPRLAVWGNRKLRRLTGSPLRFQSAGFILVASKQAPSASG